MNLIDELHRIVPGGLTHRLGSERIGDESHYQGRGEDKYREGEGDRCLQSPGSLFHRLPTATESWYSLGVTPVCFLKVMLK